MTAEAVRAVADYWVHRKLPGTDYVPCWDSAEPNCFACAAWGIYDAEAWGREHSWERGVRLEVAHVIPDSLNGTRDPRNLVLLCHECHIAAPDVADPNYMWQWLARHARTGDHMELFLGGNFRELAKTYTGPGRDIVKALLGFSDDQIKLLSEAAEKGRLDAALPFGAHFGRGPVVSAATWDAVLRDLLCRTQGILFLEQEASRP